MALLFDTDKDGQSLSGYERCHLVSLFWGRPYSAIEEPLTAMTLPTFL